MQCGTNKSLPSVVYTALPGMLHVLCRAGFCECCKHQELNNIDLNPGDFESAMGLHVFFFLA